MGRVRRRIQRRGVVMSDETPTIAEDLETLEAFFGAANDGARSWACSKHARDEP